MQRPARYALIAAAAAVMFAAIAFAARTDLERAFIAYRIQRAGVFIPPRAAGESWWTRHWRNARFYWDSSELRIARERRLKELRPKLRPLIEELDRRQAAGENMQYSMHIYREVRWMLNFTPDVARTRARDRGSAGQS